MIGRWVCGNCGTEYAEAVGPTWRPIETVPLEKLVLLWLVTENPENSGVVLGTMSFYEDGKFWDGHSYRPMAWCSHWMPLPEGPAKPWQRPISDTSWFKIGGEAAAGLKKAGDVIPPGCFCQPGKCMALVIMGRQMPCRDPEKAKGGGE